MGNFASRLKELRTEKGLSQVQLAQATKISSSAIAHWETRQRIPNLDAVIALAKFFNVTMDYICGLID